MVLTWHLIFVLLAALCFLLAGIGVPVGRAGLVAIGLLFWLIAAEFLR